MIYDDYDDDDDDHNDDDNNLSPDAESLCSPDCRVAPSSI